VSCAQRGELGKLKNREEPATNQCASSKSFNSLGFRSFSYEIREIRENRAGKRFSGDRFRFQNATLGFLQTWMATIIADVCTRPGRCHIPRSLSLCVAGMPFHTFLGDPRFSRFSHDFARISCGSVMGRATAQIERPPTTASQYHVCGVTLLQPRGINVPVTDCIFPAIP
jgi:hypothetical protein